MVGCLEQTAQMLRTFSKAHSTQKGYTTGWNHYLKFCAEEGYDVWMPYASPGTEVFAQQSMRLVLFVSYLFHLDVGAKSIGQYVNGVKKIHRRYFAHDVLEHHDEYQIQKKGVANFQRKHGRKVNQKAPFTWDMLERSHSFLDTRIPDDDLFLTVLTTGVSFLLRSSELLQGTIHSIKRKDVRFRKSAEGTVLAVTIIIQSSKTSSVPVSKTLPNTGFFSTASMLHRWMTRTKSFPLWCPLFQGMSYARFNRRFKQLTSEMGLSSPGVSFASQSLRRGGATSMFNSGVSPLYIREWGRWSSDMWVTVYARLNMAKQLSLGQIFCG